jgi:hypothetical protein
LLSWKNYYSFAFKNAGSNSFFFSYEAFCINPSHVLSNLFKEIGVDASTADLKPFKPSDKNISGYDQDLLKDCMLIYDELVSRFNIWN